MSKKKAVLLWILSFLLMAAAVLYQRMTGPTHPFKGEVTIDGNAIKYSFLRSAETGSDVEIKIPCSETLKGTIRHKIYTTDMDWKTDSLERKGDTLIARISWLPWLDAAAKVQYFISLYDASGKEYKLNTEEIRLRYKGHVPDAILLPHIIFMFLALWFAFRTALEALFKGDKVLKLSVWSLVTIFIGGIILGPLVQNYAFGAFWTGWPLGNDLTDNKTALAFLFWIIAVWRLKKNPKNIKWAFIAACISLAMYLIPHSVLGSEKDYSDVGFRTPNSTTATM